MVVIGDTYEDGISARVTSEMQSEAEEVGLKRMRGLGSDPK
jgi:hypothetical protein